MSDIHIGKITRTESGKGRAQLFYHIPIDAPVSGIVPTPTSVIEAQLQQSEIDALAAGSRVEVSTSIVILASRKVFINGNCFSNIFPEVKMNLSKPPGFAKGSNYIQGGRT